MAYGRVMRIRNGACTGPVFGLPLVSTGGAFRQFPIEVEEILQLIVAPLGWGGGPGAFEATGDGVYSTARAE